MVGGHSMGPGLQLVGARFLNFHLGKLSREFKLRPIFALILLMNLARKAVDIDGLSAKATRNSRSGIPGNLWSVKFPARIPGNF